MESMKQNVRDRMLSVGIRRDHADAIREREQDMVEPGFQGRAFPQIYGVAQHRHGAVRLKVVEDPAKLGAAPIVNDHDGSDVLETVRIDHLCHDVPQDGRRAVGWNEQCCCGLHR